MMLSELFEGVSSPGGMSHLKKWIKDCLGDMIPRPGQEPGINDFSGEVVPKLLCINFLKEIKGNMAGNDQYKKILGHLETYLQERQDKEAAMRIEGFSKYLEGKELDLLFTGKPIDKKPPSFSHFTTIEDIIQYNVPSGSGISIEDIGDGNVAEIIDLIEKREVEKLTMNPLKSSLSLFWCTRTADIWKTFPSPKGNQDAIRNELGLFRMKRGYLVEVRLSSNYVDGPYKPVFFDSGPSHYFYVADPGCEFGKTRRLSDFGLTEFTEAVHREKDWPYEERDKFKPVGKLSRSPGFNESMAQRALEEMWLELTERFPGVVEEIQSL